MSALRVWAIPDLPEDVKHVSDVDGHIWCRRTTGLWELQGGPDYSFIQLVGEYGPLTEVTASDAATYHKLMLQWREAGCPSEHPDADAGWLPDGEIWDAVEGDPAPLPKTTGRPE